MAGRKYTLSDLEYIKDNYSNTLTRDIAKHLGRSEKAIYMQAKGLNLSKDISFIAKTVSIRSKGKPNKGAFKKGCISFNKGKKQTEYMSSEAIERTKATRFKKGNLPANTKYDGALSIRPDSKTGISYIYIRLSKANWQLYHRYLWEQYYKEKLVSKDNIIFVNGNQSDFSINNLKKVSDAKLLEINAIRNKPIEYRELHSIMLKLKNKIKKLEIDDK